MAQAAKIEKTSSPKIVLKEEEKIKVMNVIWDVDSDDDNNDSDNEASHSQETNFTLMAMVEDISSGMNMETIIISKNITVPITIEFLRKIAESKKPKTQQSTMICEQSTVQAFLKQSSTNLQEEEVNVASSTSTLRLSMDQQCPSLQARLNWYHHPR
jgi:hypothetical protein